ncbi:unnamed protein product [Sphagnum balticum]
MRIAHHPKQHGQKAHFASLEPFRRNKALIDKKHDERTRGIEISIMKDANITISIWDMAGQEEFHAFHDYMMPNLGDVVSPCSFLFVFNPIMQKNEHDMHHHRRTWKELHEDLTYWLRFIASNKPTSTTFQPQLNVILTHVDQDLDGSSLVMWAQSYVVNDLRNEFKGVVDISTEIHAINALSKKDVQYVLDFVFKCGQELLSKAPFVFAETAKMRQALAKGAKGHLYHPLISWNAFCKLCTKTIPEIYYGGNEAESNDPFDPKKATIQMEEKTMVVATHLHDTGDILYFKGLEWVVVDPNWFCHDVMGILIGFKDTQHQIINGMDQAVGMEKLKLLLVTNKYNLNFRYTWPKVEEQMSGMPQQVLPTGHDLVVELLGEKTIANLMESWCLELKTISSILSNDVKELVGSSIQHGQQVSPPHDDFQVDIDLTMGQDLRCILDTFVEHARYICKKYELGVERIIEHNEAMGARIIKEFQKSSMEMKSFGEKLQQELCKKVDTFMEFTVQLK